MVDLYKFGGVTSIIVSSVILFVGLYILQGLTFEKYFMTYVIVGLVSFMSPVFGWGLGVYAIASSSSS